MRHETGTKQGKKRRIHGRGGARIAGKIDYPARLHIRMSEEMLETLRHRASMMGITPSELVRNAVADFLGMAAG